MRPRAPLAIALPLAATLVAAGGCGERAPAPVGAERLPVRPAPAALPPAVARLAWWPVAGDAPTGIAGFTLLGDTVVALDARDHRVVLLRHEARAWRVVGGWGRRGGGPGEFLQPIAVARTPAGEVAVLEHGGRIQRFAPDGRLAGAERAGVPCAMFAATLAYGPSDRTRWLAGQCIGGAPVADTIFTMLFRADGDGEYQPVARVPRMAADLRWGSVLGTLHPLVHAGGALHLGTGLDDCLLRLPAAAPAAPAPRCGLVRERLAVPEPAGNAASRRDAERRGQRQLARALRWPDAMPPYVGAIAAGGTLLLARPVAADTVALVPAGEPLDLRRAALVAPVRTLVACTHDACLWYGDERLALYRAADALARAAVPGMP